MNMNSGTMDIFIHKLYGVWSVSTGVEWLSRGRYTRSALQDDTTYLSTRIVPICLPTSNTMVSCQHLVLTDYLNFADKVHVNGSSLRLSFEDEQFYMLINHLCYLFWKISIFHFSIGLCGLYLFVEALDCILDTNLLLAKHYQCYRLVCDIPCHLMKSLVQKFLIIMYSNL